ncbi:hypothetical protein KY330_05870 [Candidatus Woesearchaeota archaeon]|nr:hypothetical protein [Candidatus Woesearchaeota archaeon]
MRKIKLKKIKIKFPNHKLFILTLLSWIVFLVVELGNRIYDLYRVAPYVDLPTHFFAGVASAFFFAWLFSVSTYDTKKLKITIASLVVAGIWELLETLEEMVVIEKPYLRDVFLWDGVGDMAAAMLGVFAVLILLHYLIEKTDLIEPVKLNSKK